LNHVLAQYEEETTGGLGLDAKLMVFLITVLVSIITDGIGCLALAGSFRPIRAIISSIPWSFVNIYWWDLIVPYVASVPFLTMKFMQVGDPAWNYWIGANVIVAFIGNLLMEQAIFRFARGAAASGWGMDLVLATLDGVLPAVLFIVLPMFGII